MGSNQYWAGRVYGCVFFDGNSRRLKRKWFYDEAGNQSCQMQIILNLLATCGPLQQFLV